MASNLYRLSVREILSAGDGDHADGGGLVLRVNGDRANWVFRYTAANGRRREMGLGVAHRGSPAQAGDALKLARNLADTAREQVALDIDPIDDRERRKAAAREVDEKRRAEQQRVRATLARVAREFHERVIEPTRTVKHAAQWLASLEHHVPEDVWHAPIDSITPPQLLQALTGVRALADSDVKVPETLQRVRQRLDAVFEDAMFHGLCSSNAAAAIKRKLQEAMGKRKRGQFAALPYRAAPDFMRKLRLQEGLAARCLELAVLTTARTSEAIEATWPEFDLEAATWNVPAERMKGGEPHTVHLVPRAIEIIGGLKGLHADYLFPSPMVKDQPLSNMAMLTVLDRMGERQNTTVHGLCRATFSTWANETGAARPDVIEACLAHQEGNKIRAAYNRADHFAARRALLEAWGDFLSKPYVSNVVPFERAAA